jgi:hypothetical protein
MPIAVACECGRSFKAKDEHAGLRAKCPSCGVILDIPGDTPDFSLPSHDGHEADDPTPDEQAVGTLGEIRDLLGAVLEALQGREPASAASGRQRQYKVLTQKDKWFSGKFDPEKLEQAINAYAGQGWAVRGITTASMPGFGGNRDEMIVLLER